MQLLGPSLIDLDEAFANARHPLAQKFKALNTGKPFVAIANHFKSKGSGVDDGTGQGRANPSREAQARQLTAWASEMFPDEAVFLMGDFNAYKAARRLVTGAAVWDINGDESIALQYSRRNYNVVDFFAPDPFASSDHDPIVVGLDTGSRGKK